MCAAFAAMPVIRGICHPLIPIMNSTHVPAAPKQVIYFSLSTFRKVISKDKYCAEEHVVK